MDGWSEKPSGWNLIDQNEYDDDIVNSDLSKLDQEQFIIVLAGGLDNLGRNHPWVKDRLDVAFRLYKLKKRKILIVGGGTYHRPPHLNRENYVIHESTMGAKYLLDLGVHPDDLYREWASYDTIANGYFSLLNFVFPMDIKSVLVITSDFHMPRSKAIFEWIYSLWSKSTNQPISLDFLEVSTKYLDNEIIEARTIRENRSLHNLQNSTMKKINTWIDFHSWFYREHQAYNCRFEQNSQENIDPKIRETY